MFSHVTFLVVDFQKWAVIFYIVHERQVSYWKSRLKGTGCKKNGDVLFLLFIHLPGTSRLTNVNLEATIIQLCKILPQQHAERQFSCNASESFKNSNKVTHCIIFEKLLDIIMKSNVPN